MKRQLPRLALVILGLLVASLPVQAQRSAVFHYTVEIELTSDQGDMPTKDYLKNYGTKGKKRGAEFVYSVINPFLVSQFEKHGIPLLSLDTLSGVKSNEYGFPATTIQKAVATGMADRWFRIHIKDISLLSLDGSNQTDPLQRQKKIVKMRCRIQEFGPDKKLVRDVEGIFQSGDKIDNPAELGIDLRRVLGDQYEQELKVYETCTKMATLKAIKALVEK